MADLIFPSLGVVTASLIALSPYATILQLADTGNNQSILKSHNFLPYPLIQNMALSWLLYGLLVKDSFVFWSNISGVLFGTFYNTTIYAALRLCEDSPLGGAISARSKITNHLRLWIGGTSYTLVGSFIAFLVFAEDLPAGQNVMGIFGTVLLLLFYTSPLTTLAHVLRTRDASSFTYSLSLTCLVNSITWTAYGTLKHDIFIWGPNSVGLLVSIIQLTLKLIFKSSSSSPYSSPLGKAGTSPIVGSFQRLS